MWNELADAVGGGAIASDIESQMEQLRKATDLLEALTAAEK